MILGSNIKIILADGSNCSRSRASSLLTTAAPAAPLPEPQGARLPFSLRARAIARQRQETLIRFDGLKGNHGLRKAAAMVGSSVVTLWRWRNLLAAHGVAGLVPKPPSGGKPSPFAGLRLTPAARREVERLAAVSGSTGAAWRQFAGCPECPPLLARHIQRHGTAPARLAGIAKLTQVNARCYLTADGRRLLVAVDGPGKGKR